MTLQRWLGERRFRRCGLVLAALALALTSPLCQARSQQSVDPNVTIELTGTFRLTADPRAGIALWGDCVPSAFEICEGNLAVIDLQGVTLALCGDHCGATPVHESSWGRIKTHYRLTDSPK